MAYTKKDHVRLIGTADSPVESKIIVLTVTKVPKVRSKS